MNTRKKSEAMRFLEDITGGPLTFGKMLEAIRLSDEISQVDLAKKLGMSKAHLCDIEKGRRMVSPKRAAKLAKLLGQSESTFVRIALQDSINEGGLKYKVRLEAA